MTNLSDDDIRQAFDVAAGPMPPFEAARRRRWLVAEAGRAVEVGRAVGAAGGLDAGSARSRASRRLAAGSAGRRAARPMAPRPPRWSPALRLTASLVAGALVVGVVVGLWSGRDRLGDGSTLAMGGDSVPMALPIGSPQRDLPQGSAIPGRVLFDRWQDALTCKRVTGFTRAATDQEITDAGIAYLLADTGAATDYQVLARADELPTDSACAEGAYATVVASYLGVEADGALTSALTIWGPDAAAPYTPPPWGEQWGSDEIARRNTPEVGETDLSGGSVTTVVWDIANKLSLGWASGEARWVITASGIDLDTALAVAARVNADHGVERIGELLPTMISVPVGPKPAASPVRLWWRAEYSTEPAADNMPVTDDEPAGDDRSEWWSLGVDRDYPSWPAKSSTEELVPDSPWDPNDVISNRIVSVDGQLALLFTAEFEPSGGVEALLEWSPQPGIEAFIRRVGDITQEDIIAVASSSFAVAMDDPRLSGHVS